MGVHNNPRNQAPAVRTGSAGSQRKIGAGRDNGMDGPAKRADGAAKRSTATNTRVERSPVRPTQLATSFGGSKNNGLRGTEQSKRKDAFAACNKPGSRPSAAEKPGPAGGLPAKGGPNRSAGVTRTRAYVKSEGI